MCRLARVLCLKGPSIARAEKRRPLIENQSVATSASYPHCNQGPRACALCSSLELRRPFTRQALHRVLLFLGCCLLFVCKNSLLFSICACHPCAGAMLIFSVSLQFQRMIPEGNPWPRAALAYGAGILGCFQMLYMGSEVYPIHIYRHYICI